MRIITGDETGLIKCLNLEEEKIVCTFGEQKKDNSILNLLFIDSNEVFINFFSKFLIFIRIQLFQQQNQEFCRHII